jgi:Xaa-Pro aminopeptidase
MFAKETYTKRREALRRTMTSEGLILVTGNGESSRNYPANAYHFRQDSTFRYFFGIELPDLAGVIDIESGEATLYGDDLTVDDIIWTGPQPTIGELGARVGISDTKPLAALEEALRLAVRKGRRVHFLPPYRAENREKIGRLLGIKACAVADHVSIELAMSVVSLRDKKSEEEIAEIEKACEIGYLMHTTAMRMCRPGVVEREIAGTIEGIALAMGAGTSFTSIVSQNGETLHNHYYGNTLADGKLLLCDAGAETATGYASDFTRTMPVGGKFTEKQKDIYNIVLAANDRAFELSQPGKLYRDIHLEAARVLIDGLKGLGLMQGATDDALAKGAYALFMPHGLGHMMGMDVHDMEDIGEKYVGYDLETERSAALGVAPLRMGRRLQPGMVMTVEPGIYFVPALIAKWRAEGTNKEFMNYAAIEKYIGFGGVRIEDDLLITATGNRMLGERRIPVTVGEIEEFMAQ